MSESSSGLSLIVAVPKAGAVTDVISRGPPSGSSSFPSTFRTVWSERALVSSAANGGSLTLTVIATWAVSLPPFPSEIV